MSEAAKQDAVETDALMAAVRKLHDCWWCCDMSGIECDKHPMGMAEEDRNAIEHEARLMVAEAKYAALDNVIDVLTGEATHENACAAFAEAKQEVDLLRSEGRELG
jgi:hypothetical protein